MKKFFIRFVTPVAVALISFLVGRAFSSKTSELARVIDLLNENRAEVMELKDALRNLGSKLQAAPSPPLKPPGEDVVTVADLLKNAEQLRKDNRLREAEIILTRAVQTDRDNVAAWRSLAAVQRETAIGSVATGNLLLAAQQADRALTSLNALIGISVDPSPKMETKIVVDEESATADVSSKLREAIDKACVTHIANAKQSATNASNSFWNVLAIGLRDVKNDRGEVINGLKHLKNVFELGAWASESTRTSANDAYSKLKKLVNPEEWNDLLARAGFDPTSRDTLKKWGLE